MKMKDKKCKNCGATFSPAKPLQYVCCPRCAIIYSKKLQEAKDKKETAKRKKELLTKSDYEKILQQLVNKIIRVIDYGQPCISSNLKKGKVNAGHFFSVGSNPSLRFNLHNIHGQSEYSNTYLHGDLINYRRGLINRYGIEYIEFIERLQGTYPVLKLTIEQLKDCIENAKKFYNIIKSVNVNDVETRIRMREIGNEYINIYNTLTFYNQNRL